MMHWANDAVQYGDDRNLTTYTIATPWAKSQLAPLRKHLFSSMASYDDAEDRGLTAQAMAVEWETVYAPTAVVYTDVPENFRTIIGNKRGGRKAIYVQFLY